MTAPVRRRDLLVAISAFFLVAAVMMHLLAENRFAASWPTNDTVVTSVASSATYVDPATLDAYQGRTLVRQRAVARTVSAVDGADAVLVSTTTRTPAGRVVARARWSAVQQRFSGAAVDSPANIEKSTEFNTSGDAVETQRTLFPVRGVLARFPRDTRPTTYRRWDPETGRTGDAVFEGRARLEGAEVLVFRQREPAAVVAATGTSLASDTLLWVRPEVGAVVKSSTHVVDRPASGGPATLDARFVDDAASVRRMMSEVDRAVDRLHVLGTVAPAVALILGTMAALIAVLEGRTGRLRGHRLRRTPPLQHAASRRRPGGSRADV